MHAGRGSSPGDDEKHRVALTFRAGEACNFQPFEISLFLSRLWDEQEKTLETGPVSLLIH
jgi:hypothetical protein